MGERLTWEEIKERYPNQWIGLADIEWKDTANIKTAIVKYTGMSQEELLIRQHKKEIVCWCTMTDNVCPMGFLSTNVDELIAALRETDCIEEDK